MIDLSRFEKMYDSFDDSHNRRHMLAVRGRAVVLSKKYAPDLKELAYIAATLHDIGLFGGKENHEKRAIDMIKADKQLNAELGNEKIEMIIEAVKEHRATTGKPKSILSKIISDADRISSDTSSECLNRSYYYQVKENPGSSESEKLLGAGKQVYDKYKPNGPGRRVYFPETEILISGIVDPIIDSYEKGDVAKLAQILNGLYKNYSPYTTIDPLKNTPGRP